MFPFLSFKSSTLLGLDIDTEEVRLLKLMKIRKQFIVDNFAIAPLPSGAMVDGKIKQPDEVQSILHDLVKKSEAMGAFTAISLPESSVIHKRFKVVAGLPEEDTEREVKAIFNRNFHGIGQDYYLDFTVLPSRDAMEDEVMVVAAHHELVNSYLSTVSCAGLMVKVVDIDTFALKRVMTFSSSNTNANPFEKMALADGVDEQLLRFFTPRLLVCCGLAIREMPKW